MWWIQRPFFLAVVLVLAACGSGSDVAAENIDVSVPTVVPTTPAADPSPTTASDPTATPDEPKPEATATAAPDPIATSEQTNTAVPPTSTPVPPTSTPVPPTSTPVPPTSTPVPPTAVPVVDTGSRDYLAIRGLYHVPDATPRCEYPAPDQPVGTAWGAYSDAAAGGDLYVVCTSPSDGAVPQLVTLRDPSNGTVSTIRLSGAEVEPGGQWQYVVGESTARNEIRYVGLLEQSKSYDGGTPFPIVQLHVWLPTNRPAGDWVVQFEAASGASTTGVLTVDAPCAASVDTALVDPFFFPANLATAGFGLAENIGGRPSTSQNCRVAPAVVGLPTSEARSVLATYAAQRGLVVQADVEVGGCAPDGRPNFVTSQWPLAGQVVNGNTTFDVTESRSCPIVPDGLIGRTWPEVQQTLDGLVAANPDWSYSGTSAAALECKDDRTVTNVELGSPQDSVGVWVHCAVVVVSGNVWLDADGDGVRGSAEFDEPDRVEEVILRLWGPGDSILDTASPNQFGSYQLSSQQPGPYLISVQLSEGIGTITKSPASVQSTIPGEHQYGFDVGVSPPP